jgi:hypothetical protein
MAWVSNGVNGMMSIRLKTRGKYFKFANPESIFRNDTKKLLYSVINPKKGFDTQGLTKQIERLSLRQSDNRSKLFEVSVKRKCCGDI